MTSENAITKTNANQIDVQREAGESQPAHYAGNEAWTYRPDADIIEEDNRYLITIDMPGVSADGVDLSVEQNVLTVVGRVDHCRINHHGQRQWMRQEYGVGDYFRRFQLDETIDIDAIDASCDNGVLRITLPKHQAAQPKRITVSTASSQN